MNKQLTKYQQNLVDSLVDGIQLHYDSIMARAKIWDTKLHNPIKRVQFNTFLVIREHLVEVQSPYSSIQYYEKATND